MNETTKIKTRILHCSDIHLDMPFVGLSAEKCDERRRSIRSSFVKMMQYVRDTKIDMVLMSGDVFDVEYATNATAELLIREFKATPDTVFIIAPGKSDYYKDNPIYASGRLPENCYVFNANTSLCRYDFEEKSITVYGWAFTESELRTCPLRDKRVDDTTLVNLVCGYADLNGAADSTNCPVSSSDLKKFGADYYALGGHHQSSKFVTVGASKYSYSGSLECTGFEDPGIGGVNLVTIEHDEEGLTSIENKSMSFGHVRFESEKLDITGVNTTNEIINRISRMISDRKYDSETALRVELTGYLDPRFYVPKNLEHEAFGLYFFKVTDRTIPLFNTEHFKRDMSAAGEVYRHFYPILMGEDEEKRLVAARAFRMALAALENRDTDS